MICIKQVDRNAIIPLVNAVCEEKNNPFYYLKEGGDCVGTIHVAFFSDDNKIVGCLSMSVTVKMHYDIVPQYKINGICVDKEHRGQGVGFALVKMAEFIALNNQVQCVWLESNEYSQKYFAKQGYESKIDPDTQIEVLFKYPEEHCCTSCESCAQNSVCHKISK